MCRAISFKSIKEYDKAISDYNEAIRLDPNDSLAYKGRGGAWREKKAYDTALLDLNQAIKLDQKHAFTYAERALVWMEKGETKNADADWEICLRLDPKSGDGEWALAWHCATCPNESHRNAQKAVENALISCRKTNWRGWYNIDALAAAYAESGDFKKAIEWQTKAVEMAGITEKADFQKRLDLYKAGKPFRDE